MSETPEWIKDFGEIIITQDFTTGKPEIRIVDFVCDGHNMDDLRNFALDYALDALMDAVHGCGEP